MSKRFALILGLLVVVVAVSSSASAKPKEIKYKDKTYYAVDGNDKNLDSGNEVCASWGKTCVGYTGQTNDICKKAHPGASATESVNGSKAGFYCDGPPQKGLACETAKNNCQVCPRCNVNADCTTAIGEQFREMYVECSGGEEVIEGPNWWGKFRSSIAHWLNALRQRLIGILVKKVTVKVTDSKGNVATAELPSDSVACEFFQTNKKLVTCAALKAADTFCTTAMQSRFARAVLCQENGIIICTKPCHPSPVEVPLKQCAFDNDRPRGKQAPPLDFCNEAITVSPGPTPGTKKAGQECQHGGECATTFCLGQTSDQGIKYFCSCAQNRLDFTCGR